jgi:hypothetical protein
MIEWTKRIILIGLVSWGLWDIYVASNSMKGDTISEIVLAWAWKRPIVPFITGVVMGHLFWPQKIK